MDDFYLSPYYTQKMMPIIHRYLGNKTAPFETGAINYR